MATHFTLNFIKRIKKWQKQNHPKDTKKGTIYTKVKKKKKKETAT